MVRTSSRSFQDETETGIEGHIIRAWRFTGGAHEDTAEAIRAAVERMPRTRRDCHDLYTVLFSGFYPGPDFEIWVKFGFCVAYDKQEEMRIAQLYKVLIEGNCTFEEFCVAYETASLPSLFKSEGLWGEQGSFRSTGINFSLLQDVLQFPPNMNRSVWNLKQIVSSENVEKVGEALVLSVWVDYGFINCSTEDEKLRLKNTYKKLFLKQQMDPLKLHEACIQGNLYKYVGRHVNFTSKNRKFHKRVLKNFYPLPKVSPRETYGAPGVAWLNSTVPIPDSDAMNLLYWLMIGCLAVAVAMVVRSLLHQS